jgi:hypothetical protein
MRRVFPLLLVLTIVGACHRAPDEITRPDAAPPAAPVEASVATAAPTATAADAGSTPASEFCRGAFTADERRMHEKCSVGDLGSSQSMARAAARLCTRDVDLIVSRSRADFDRDAAHRCVEMLEQKQLVPASETDTVFAHFPCDRVIVGLQPEGQACRYSLECKEGLACVGYRIDRDGTCKKPPAAREACTLQQYGTLVNVAAAEPHHPACAAGAYCDGTTCQSRIARGKACAANDSCAAGLSCIAGKCGPRGAAGTACGATSDCVFGLFCDGPGDRGPGVCAAKRSDGQDCTRQDACKGRCDFPKGPDGHPALNGACVSVCGSG